MSENQNSAKDHPLPESTLLIISLGGVPPATGPVAGPVLARCLVFSPAPPDGTAQVPVDVTHIAAIPGPETGDSEVIHYNMPGLASLSAPTAALRDLLPGLMVTGRRPVQRLGPQDLARVLPTGGDVAVQVLCPGAEAEILDALWHFLGPDRITQITLHCGEAAFFDGAKGRADLEHLLRERAYDLTACDNTDPDWPMLCFRPDLKARQITALDLQVKALTATLATVRAAQAEAEARLLCAQTEAEAREAQLLAQTRSLQEAKDAADQSLAALRAEQDSLRQTLALQQTAAAEAIKKRDDCLAELALAARLQAMQTLDLRDLRSQLEHSTRDRQRQEDLLRNLTPRLAQAAAHLHALNIGQPEAPAEPIGKDMGQVHPGSLQAPQKDKKRRKTGPGSAR